MENRFEHLPPEENQGWGAYATPPRLPGQQHNQQASGPSSSALCARVRESLPYLLDNDGEISPQMATALYGHLSVCAGCAREFDEMQQVVRMVETLGQAELPMDFSLRIMRHIQSGQTSAEAAPKDAAARPFAVITSTSSLDAPRADIEVVKRQTQPMPSQQTNPTVSRQTTIQGLETSLRTEQDLLLRTGVRLWERLTLAGLLSTVMTFFLMTQWGGQVLGANLSGLRAWFNEIGETLHRVPVQGALFAVMFSALSQVGDLLSETYRSLGGMAARGLALDIALCAGIYYLFVLRRQRGQMRGI